MEQQNLIPPNSTFSFSVPESMQNSRIDSYIAQQFPLYSRSFFQRIIDNGFVQLNGKQVTKQSVPVQKDDLVTVVFPPARTVDPVVLADKHKNISIVGQEDHFLVVNKPAGLMVHQSSSYSTAPTLVDWIIYHYDEISSVGAIDRPGIVHRLDKDTSGLIIVPRTNYAHALFSDKFRDRSIKKTYLAIVMGHPPKTGIIDAPIGRDIHNRTKMATYPQYAVSNSAIRPSLTEYTVREYFEHCSLVEVRPVTGRTHQIRVHFASIGHPLLGDPIYGKSAKLMKRQALHAHKLSFHFDGKEYLFTQDVPNDFSSVLETLRKTNL